MTPLVTQTDAVPTTTPDATAAPTGASVVPATSAASAAVGAARTTSGLLLPCVRNR